MQGEEASQPKETPETKESKKKKKGAPNIHNPPPTVFLLYEASRGSKGRPMAQTTASRAVGPGEWLQLWGESGAGSPAPSCRTWA